MPDPGTLEQYERLIPGIAERVLRVHESQTIDVAERENRLVAESIRHGKATDKRANSGQSWAMALSAVCVIAVIALVFQRNYAGAGIVASVPMVVLVGSFLPGGPGWWRRLDD